MENKAEEIKVVQHSQHVRILKEDDEIWISSEDLNTENSSDEENKTRTKNAYKKKLKLKTRKRSTPNIKLQRPSIPNNLVSTTSKDLDDRLLMPSSTIEDNSRSTDDSRTSDEEIHQPSIPPTECLLKRLSLEDWRPMKGALSASSTLEDNASASGDDDGNFFDAMLDKLKSLKNCSVSRFEEEKLVSKEKSCLEDEKSFECLKNTPQVRQQLDFINQLNKEIEATVSLYKQERTQRLNTELELYENVSGENLLDAEKPFLEMCRRDLEKFKMPFGNEETGEFNNNSNNDESKKIDAAEMNKENNNARNFIKKNIYAAREGTMANFPLTDDEKIKIEELLKDIDNFEIDDAASDSENNIEQEIGDGENCFSLLEAEKQRILEIDDELKKFVENHQKENLLPVKDEKFWNLDFEQPLKDIDARLEKLHDLDNESIIMDTHDCEKSLKQLKEEFPEI